MSSKEDNSPVEDVGITLRSARARALTERASARRGRSRAPPTAENESESSEASESERSNNEQDMIAARARLEPGFGIEQDRVHLPELGLGGRAADVDPDRRVPRPALTNGPLADPTRWEHPLAQEIARAAVFIQHDPAKYERNLGTQLAPGPSSLPRHGVGIVRFPREHLPRGNVRSERELTVTRGAAAWIAGTLDYIYSSGDVETGLALLTEIALRLNERVSELVLMASHPDFATLVLEDSFLDPRLSKEHVDQLRAESVRALRKRPQRAHPSKATKTGASDERSGGQ